MTNSLTGLIVSKRLGALYIPLFDAPYSVAQDYSYADATQVQLGFARGTIFPVLFNYAKNGTFLSRQNSAVLGVIAPTLYKSGDQANLTGVVAYNDLAPCYYSGLMAVGYILATGNPSTFYWVADAQGVGGIAPPDGKIIASGTFNGRAGVFSDTCIQLVNGKWYFANTFLNGASNAFMYLWGPNGTIISSQLPVLQQFPFYYTQMYALGYFPNVGNVMLCILNFAGTLRIVLINLDSSQQIISAFVVQLEEPTIDALLCASLGVNTTRIKTVSQGFLFTIPIPGGLSYGGVTRYMLQILLSADGGIYAPCFVMPQTAATAVFTTAAINSNFFLYDFTIDPTGVYWTAANLTSATIPIGTSFGSILQNPVTPQFQGPNLPAFHLACYTPCDIVAPTIPSGLGDN